MGRRHLIGALVVCAAALLAAPRSVLAQVQPRFDAGVQVAAAAWRQFDGSDLGVGGRFAWHPAALLGVTTLQVELEGTTRYVLTTDTDAARNQLSAVQSRVIRAVELSSVVKSRFSGLALLTRIG